jgi:hypothetical protein
MAVIKHELTSGDIGVMASILCGVVGMTLYVADVKATAILARESNENNMLRIEADQLIQNQKMDRLQITQELVANTLVRVTTILEERTGKPIPKQ